MNAAREQLKRRLQEALFEQTREFGFMFLDPDGTIVGWSGSAREIFGYEESEVLGTPGSLIFTAEDAARGLHRHELAVARQESRSEDERWHVRKDGTRIWVTGAVDAIRGEDGGLLGYVKTFRDRTDLRTQVEALENSLRAEKTARTYTREFLRTLGHEIRNPLSPLASGAAILERLPPGGPAERIARIIKNQVAALERLAGDLSDAARLDTGQVALSLQAQDLRRVIEDLVLGFSADAQAKGVALEAVLPPTPLVAAIDRARFEPVLLNLLANALKYTPAGGRVWCKATREGRDVVVRVEDTGMGIDAAMLPRIFDLFARAPRAEEVAPEGLGIGLSIAHEIMKLHGGSLSARSGGAGMGAEFTVRLPVAEDPGRDS